ncbi:MAG TPA: plasmid stabilization protein [Polyangia bacterium]|nr:plasmid stabilization protein [Polyangia bacterium]
MATLTIRKLPESTKARLRTRAARAGRSMEAEAREILTVATAVEEEPADPAELQALVDDLYAGGRPAGVVEDLIAERRRSARDE